MTPSEEALARILLETRAIAMVGASVKPERPSNGVGNYMVQNGYRVIPVNPMEAGKEILGQKVYASLSDVPPPVDMVDIFRSTSMVPAIADEILAMEPLPKVVWMQLEIVNEEAAQTAREAGLQVVMDRCMRVEHMRLIGQNLT